jgi:class 3 adenylate cyclase
MSEYADSFARNDIDFDVLPELTDQDLERLGVSLGHRRKILRAIRALGPNTSTDVTAAPAPKSSALLDTAAGERRYVTVMFCDLVGSTEICAGLDAEEWRDLVGEYLEGASAAVTDMGGTSRRSSATGF